MNDTINQKVPPVTHNSLTDNSEDLTAFEERDSEPLVAYETLLNELQAAGRI